jgi:ribose transport system permease protein
MFGADEMGVVISLFFVILVTTIIRRDFLTLDNFKVMFIQISYVAIVALGTSFPLMTGNVDISTGRVAGLGGMVMSALLVTHGWSTVPSIIVALLAVLVI